MRSAEERLDRRMMRLALRAGARGDPSPNPHVGAVLAKDARVVGVGHHERAGEAHAEVCAIRAAGAEAEGATAYVTLAPCNHHGRTPPCTDALIAAKVARVVIGADDPTGHTDGGEEKLRAAGIEVTRGVLRERAEALLAPFAKHARTGLPHLTLKAALTLDGRMAARGGDSKWITGERARAHAHRLRSACDAVLVGVGTVLADDPRLTVRLSEGRDPARVVLDSRLRTPAEAAVIGRGSKAPCLIVHGPDAPEARRRALLEAGAALWEAPAAEDNEGGLDLPAILVELGRRGWIKVLVEGGPRLHGALLRGGHLDRAALFYAPKLLGDPEAMPLAYGPPLLRIAEGYRLEGLRLRRLPPDWMVEGRLVRGADPS